MEVWNGYNKDGSLANQDLFRGKPIPKGLYHIVSEVFVKHIDGTYLLMQRDYNKEGYPGLYEAGASGSILKGESPSQGAIRELKEETGIFCDDLTLIYVQSDYEKTFYYSYICTVDCPKNSIVLQEGETIFYKWLDREAFLDFIKSDFFVPTQRDRMLYFLNKI